MTGLDPKKLLYFVAVLEHGSLNRAARALNVSQPALSTSMDRLEASLGLRLLERGPRGVASTQAGETLYRRARLIRDELEKMERDLSDVEDTPQPLIRIGALPSLSGTIIPLALHRWSEAHPDRQLQVVEAPQIDLVNGLLRREFDFVVGLTEVFDISDGLRQRVLFRDTLCVNARPEHPLVGRADLSWDDLVHHRWVAVTPRWDKTILGQVMSAMNVGPLQQITVCGSLSLMKSMASASDYLALLPAHASRLEREEGRLVALPFEDDVLRRDIAVFFREGYRMDPAREALIATIRALGIELSLERPTEGPA